jgi:hypothetical protein
MADVATRRIAASNDGPTTINRRHVKVFFQSFPGTSAASGISGLSFILQVPQAPAVVGSTPADGHIDIRLAAGETANLKILGSEYSISLLDGVPFPVTQMRGVQQRLNMLGYHAGNLRADANPAVDATDGGRFSLLTEIAILNFQADHDPLFIDGIAGTKTQPKITQTVKSAGGE